VEIEMPPAPSGILRISNETLPARDRFSAFQEEVAQKILQMDVIDRSARHPRIEVAFMRFGTVAVGAGSCTPAEFIRYNHHLKDCSDGFRLDIVARAPLQLSHGGEERTYDVGWGLFLHHARPFRRFGPCGVISRNVTVQAAALEALVAHPEDLAGHPVRPGPALRLLDGYLESLASLDEPPSPESARFISDHLLDLVAAALGPTTKAAEIIATRGLKAARTRAILAQIARRFSDCNIDLDNVAAALGLSRRYVQRLLEETGKSFTEHLVERRLERSFAMLTDRRYLHLAIIDIALAAGFGDVSHFNRVFRRRFGDTPSGARAAAIRPKQA
jgi:AraC-like DNA-binding protein